MENPKLKKESERYLKEEVGVLDNTLFVYLLQSMIERFKEGSSLIDEDVARQMCKVAFIAQGITPDFIATEPLGDFYHAGSLEWKAFYCANRKLFETMKVEGSECLVVDIDRLYGANFKKADQIRNKLPPDVVRSSGTPLILRKKEFLSFIGEEKGWFGRILG